MLLNLVRFAIPEDQSPDWAQVQPLIDGLQADGLDEWSDYFIDIPEIGDNLNPYDPADPDHERMLPEVKAQLAADVELLSEAVDHAPGRQIAVSKFAGYLMYFTGGMIDGGVGAASPVHAAAQRLYVLGGLKAAGFSHMVA